jgi:predicted ester cyclase
LIRQYSGADTVVYCLDGIIRGASEMIDGTKAMLAAYPDRLLIPDDVIWSGNQQDGYYSSHRIISPMTNQGPTPFGPATGKKVQILTIADCVVEQGVITGEWLYRDNLALVRQLGFDGVDSARIVAARRNGECNAWIATEIDRLAGAGVARYSEQVVDPLADPERFAQQVIANNWSHGVTASVESSYAPYAVQHRSPIEVYSGRDAVSGHYRNLRDAIDVYGVSVDHVAVQPADSQGLRIAVRWTVAGRHCGDYQGVAASGKPVFVLGASHWHIEAGRIAQEWTIFDSLAVLSQMV